VTEIRQVDDHLLRFECARVPGVTIWDRLRFDNRITLALQLYLSFDLYRICLEVSLYIVVEGVKRAAEEEIVEFDICIALMSIDSLNVDITHPYGQCS
jgi:hypothetical protein